MNKFLTAYSDLLYRVASHTIVANKERSVTDYLPPHEDGSVKTMHVDYLSDSKQYQIAVDDYDEFPEDKIPHFDASLIQWFQRHMPISDEGERWESAEECKHVLMDRFKAILDPALTDWGDANSDEVFTFYCTQSVIAHRLEKDDKSNGYRVPLAWMQQYSVRDGVEPVGSDAYFDENMKPVRIEGFRGKTVKPGDADWEMAKFHHRSAGALCATIPDHAIYTHMISANSMAVSTRRSLSAQHPVRRLLSPFHIKSIGIDQLAAVTLTGEGAMINRLCGFTWDGLQALYRRGLQEVPMQTVPELLERNQTVDLDGKYPWGQDALPLYQAIENFAGSYLALYYDENLKVKETGEADSELSKWIADIRSLWPWPEDTMRDMSTLKGLIDAIAIMMWSVTGWHQHIALPVDSARTPDLFAQCISSDAKTLMEMWPIKEKSITNMLLVALTAPRGPKLMQDFSHFMLDNEARSTVRAFHAELEQVSKDIKERNKTRDYELRSFDPYNLQISVST